MVGWAGWKWVKARQGKARYCWAKRARLSITATSRSRTISRASRRQDQVRVVGHVAACRAEVDDRPGLRADVAIGMDVGHHVVPQPPLVPFGRREIDRIDVLPQLGDLFLSDRQAQFRLGLGQGHPQPPPGAELPLRAPQLAHRGRRIAADQGVVVLGVLVRHGARENYTAPNATSSAARSEASRSF